MTTYEEVSCTQLMALADALGQSHASSGYIDLQASLMAPWNALPIAETPPYPSLIGDDHSPYEYSVAYGQQAPELRILMEAQASVPTLAANYEAALRLNASLRTRWGVSLAKFDQVADLFAPPDRATNQGFSLWHAACLSPDGTPDFKIYLNPQLHGADNANDLVKEVFVRLGLRDAYGALGALRLRGNQQDELKYISLDLSEGPAARLKVYVCHHQVRPGELERAFAVAPSHRDGDVHQFCAIMAPQVTCFEAKPVSSCLAFVAGQNVPHTATLHLPIAHYAESDAAARRRIATFMRLNHMDELIHTRVLRAMARQPLDQSSGVQSYASYRRQGSLPRLTVYLSPELFRRAAPQRCDDGATKASAG